MLCDVDANQEIEPWHQFLLTAIANGKPANEIKRIAQGIYEINHFNFEYVVNTKIKQFPEIRKHRIEFLGNIMYSDCDTYGVCDNYQQILANYPELQDTNRKFVISLTCIKKEDQPPHDGWRWHKWGEYIGTKTPQYEYLSDEPDIEQVYVYSIYEIEEN